MKTLTKILSIVIAIMGVLFVVSLIDLKNLQESFFQKIISLSINNLLPFMSIAICSYCLEKNNNNYLLRIIPIYFMIPIILSVFIIFFEIESGFIVDLYSFLCCTYLEILGLSLILVINPNNVISNFTKYLAYILFAIEFVIAIVLFFNKSIPDFTDSTSLLNFNTEVLKTYIIFIVAQTFTILVLYISNYAFSEKIELEADEIDYDIVKEEAKALANAQMNNIYNMSPKNNEPDRSASNNGLMNINNQLGQNSNVGTVRAQAKEMNVAGSTLDSLMPLSKGPVINSTIQEEVKPVETTPPTEENVEPTLPPNLDVQEQMKLRMEQNNQTNNE